jgi:leucyl-tRNA synthetase
VVQINGKVRDRVTLPASVGEDAAKAAALASQKVQEQLSGKPPRQVIYVPGRLVNIVK